MHRSLFRTSSVFLLLAGGLFAAGAAEAQYFGRNKVRYENFDFRVLRTDHFDIYFYPQDNEVSYDVARMAERWYKRYSGKSVFNHEFVDRKPIILYANHADFQQTNVLSGFVSEGTGGVTESLKGRVILPLTADYAGTDHVLGHELVHAFQYDIAFAQEDSAAFRLAQLPLYLVEGMAEYLSVGRDDPHTAMWMRDAVLHDDFPTIKALATDSRYFPYRFGQALWAYIGGTWGDEKVAAIYRASGRQTFEWALGMALGVTSDSLSGMWADAVKKAYGPALEGRTKPADTGTRLLAEDLHGGALNIAPVLSPDGAHALFLSERDLFAVDLFVADAGTGVVEKKLVSSAVNPHFDALRFIDSAGSWSPDGRQVVFVVFARGNNELVVVDAHKGKIEKRITPHDVGAISNPSWSPDGRHIVFSGSSYGSSDLFLLDVEADTLTQLTRDRYAEMQPAWSPDGGTLAFVTDQGPDTDLDRLKYGPMRIGLLDLATGGTRLLAPFPASKHINPQFSPDGKSLFFISDRGGFSDVYRLDLATEEVYQVTRVATGVSGITALSPALSVARSTGRLLFSVFDGGKYSINRLEPEQTVGTKVDPAQAGERQAALLPPTREEPDSAARVAAYLADADSGLPTGASFPISKYKPRIQLDYIGGMAGAGTSISSNGAALGGAVSAYFSDMLNHHTIGVGLQANGALKDVGGQAVYLNTEHRWTWGGGLSHIPYFSYATRVIDTTAVVDGTTYPALKVEQTRDRVFLDEAALTAAYPFSSTRRVEFEGGYSHYMYDRSIVAETSVEGILVNRDERNVDDPAGLGLLFTTASLVGDNSFFGFTSPISGSRYRLEVSPTFGSLQYVTLRADYRRYVLLRPVTLAARAMHVGRYGKNADSNQLNEFFLGYATLVRGYSSGSFELSECSGGQANCPEFDRLVGSKIGVANLEVRLPLFGTKQFGLINFPYVPTELAAFVDGGVAWNGDQSPEIVFKRESSARIPVFSTGLAARVNILGALILEAYYAFPLQRPEKNSGVFGVQLVPGW